MQLTCFLTYLLAQQPAMLIIEFLLDVRFLPHGGAHTAHGHLCGVACHAHNKRVRSPLTPPRPGDVIFPARLEISRTGRCICGCVKSSYSGPPV
eukprot:7295744-Prymnesium_polylepis.1